MFKASNHRKAFCLMLLFIGAIFSKTILTCANRVDLARHAHGSISQVANTDSTDAAIHSLSFKTKRKDSSGLNQHAQIIVSAFVFSPSFCALSNTCFFEPSVTNPDPWSRLRPPTQLIAS